MDIIPRFFRRLHASLLLGLVVALFHPPALRADDSALVLQAQLIWATDSEKPDDAKCKDLDADLQKRLSRVFKWKHYYEMRRKQVVVRRGKTTRVEMSGKCVLKFALPDPETVEVRLIGEGRLTKTTRQPVMALKNGEIFVLAGETKDDVNDAWFVVISVPKSQKDKDAESKGTASPEAGKESGPDARESGSGSGEKER